MSIISNLLGMWAIGKTISNTTPIFTKLLLGVVAVTAFAVFASVLAAMLLVGGTWFLYVQMIAHGADNDIAALTIACLLIALLAMSAIIMREYIYRIRRISKRIIYMQTPLTTRLTNLADAFASGLLHTPR